MIQSLLILASSSPRRTQLLSSAGVHHTVQSADVDETPLPKESPLQMVKRLSILKAMTVVGTLDQNQSGFIIAADTTVVSAKKKNLGKPETEKEAISMIQSLQGKKHHVFTAYTVLKFVRGKFAKRITRSIRTDVHMRKLNSAEILDYVSRGESMDKAGAYAAQGFGMVLIEKISGSYTNVIGLPVAEVIQDLKKLGYRVQIKK